MALTATLAVASIATSAYGAYSSKKAGDKLARLGNQQAARQAYYDDQLRSLLADPSKIYNDPGYKEAFSQGTQAVERSASAQGFTGSGNAAIALQQFGQSFASDYLRQQQQLLASLSGAQNNPTQAMSAGANANANAYSQLGNTLASLGYTLGKDSGGSYPSEGFGSSTSIPGTMEGSGGYIVNIPGS